MKTQVSLVRQLKTIDGERVYILVGAVVATSDEIEFVPLAPIGEEWAREYRASYAFWNGSPLQFLEYAYDRNGTNTSFDAPMSVAGASFREAAEKAKIRSDG